MEKIACFVFVDEGLQNTQEIACFVFVDEGLQNTQEIVVVCQS